MVCQWLYVDTDVVHAEHSCELLGGLIWFYKMVTEILVLQKSEKIATWRSV